MQLPSQFNARAVQPASADGGGSNLPVGEWPVVIVASPAKETKDQTGGYVELMLQIIDGPHKGAEGAYRLNLFNASAQAVQIANRQLSSICHVTGVYDVQATEQLHGKPFIAVVKSQGDAAHPERTQVAGVKDMNGNDPGKAGAGAPPPQAMPPAAPPAAPAAPAGGWAPPAAAAPAAWAPPAAPAAAAPAVAGGWTPPSAGAVPAAGGAPPWGQR